MNSTAQQRQDQPGAHEPGVEQHTYGLIHDASDCANEHQRNPELVAVVGLDARREMMGSHTSAQPDRPAMVPVVGLLHPVRSDRRRVGLAAARSLSILL
jgi:hypothetical protein